MTAQGHAPPAVLYSFRRCPYAIRARMGLHAAGVAVQIREVALRDKPASLRLLSPKATVPVLQLSDGTVLDESLDILLWALRQHDPEHWLAGVDDDAVRRWVTRNDTDFKPLLDRYKYAPRHPEMSARQHRDKALQAFVGPLDDVLAGRPFLCGTRPGWADVAVFPFVRQFAMVEPAWFADEAAVPSLRRWLASWLASPWFEAVMAKRPVWVEPRPDVGGRAQALV
ncbi:MAG: glutathione S-transferase [Rhodoferax sp.]|nr:glutathione S-transferase [Rhodoferax sp.]